MYIQLGLFKPWFQNRGSKMYRSAQDPRNIPVYQLISKYPNTCRNLDLRDQMRATIRVYLIIVSPEP